MKTKMFMSMLVIALAAALVGGATMAWFTDTATNEANTFTAGNLDVAAGPQTYTVAINNMAPGDTINGSFTVTNTGTLNLKYKVTANTDGATNPNSLFRTGGATVTFTGGTETGTIAATDPDSLVTVTYTVALPSSAGNAFQGDSGTLSFTVDATQPNNPGWTE
jgi:predicted ribosomally synthesized peptide with SipW-like signal peptide